jgi:hypothetical protein
MWIDVARPIALLLCVLSLCALFYTVFLIPATQAGEITWTSVTLLSLAAGICLASGMIFLEPDEHGPGALAQTLPVQLFLWGVGLIVVLFVSAWYLETNGIFYKDVRRL